MAPLWRLASELLFFRGRAAGAAAFLNRLQGDRAVVALLAPLLGDRVLTISYSSTIRDVILLRHPVEVLCMASEPGGEGQRMVDALADSVYASVIEDDQAIEKVPADVVVVGADAVSPTSVLNKTKTREIAEAARDREVPCFAVVGETKFVPEELPAGEPFQRSDLALFTAIATPLGLLTPTEAAAHAEEVELHDALRTLIERFDEDDDEAPSGGTA
jgi:translation initiation factor 2B subunit (eIF-2B alpha/beta/delta family)